MRTFREMLHRCVPRIPSDILDHHALQQSVGFIEAKNSGSRLADQGLRFNDQAIEREMISPMIRARVEESDVFTSAWCNRPNIRSLGAIAKRAGVAQVVGFSRPAMFFRDDVIDLATDWNLKSE